MLDSMHLKPKAMKGVLLINLSTIPLVSELMMSSIILRINNELVQLNGNNDVQHNT